MRLLLTLLACLFVIACGSDAHHESSHGEADSQAAVQDMTVASATRNVSCGCTLQEVGHCGNYIEIDSKYVEIANGEAMGLGKMEWCGKSGVTAESEGAIEDGKFVATTLAAN